MNSLVLGYEVLVDGFAELSCCLMMLGVFRFAYFWVQLLSMIACSKAVMYSCEGVL